MLKTAELILDLLTVSPSIRISASDMLMYSIISKQFPTSSQKGG